MFDILKGEVLDEIENNIISTKHGVNHILEKLDKVTNAGTGKVVNLVKLGYQPVTKNAYFPICKKKVAIMKDNRPEVREVSVNSTSDYIRVIDTSDAGREYVLSIDEIISLADKCGLFR